MKLNSYILKISILSTLIFAGCSADQVRKKQPQNQKTGVVQFIHPVSDQPSYALSLPGELKPYEEVIIYPKVKGFVKKIFVDRGSKVKKGQLLAILEAPEISQHYLSARADENKFHEDYLYSLQAYERLMKAATRAGAVAAIELDKARSKFRSDSAAYAAVKATTGASAQLQQYLRIIAPFDGTVIHKNISAGALVGDQVPLFSIAQTSRLRLTVAIPEKHVQAVGKDTKVSFTVSDHPGQLFFSVLSRKSDLLQQESRAVTAEFDISNTQHVLNGGEYAQVKLTLQRPHATLWVPVSSIVVAQSGIFIVKIVQGKSKRVSVTAGTRKGELQEIFGPVREDDQILVKGTEELADGTEVRLE
ncbi:efflux RND transporter periplasmic adaptor subunit [Pedobacter cryoconitis]|uniref:efflux RND transporter periplasmic adaptor subunit n=1 Tax=Pedobacter cryoconitis TaxID=188932 RepID=UPI00161E91B5|nr:efflux RND transporter periplasmic adaptor subunit [Pedobacter cryoconitis]MBB5646722.1 RND family efflux transporter MFP subunit [Pedobacter cryoconitis]